LVPATEFLGPEHANVELKPSDASANPYLALTVVIAAGLAGIAEGLVPPAAIQEDPGTWTEARRSSATDHAREQLSALLANDRLRAALGPQLIDAYRAVREADAAWAADKPIEDVVAAHRWKY
jgi:glutamine synthetase